MAPAQCITSVTYDTTSAHTFVYFTKADSVQKVILFASDTTGVDTTSLTQMTHYETKSPIKLGPPKITYGKTMKARLVGYRGATAICSTWVFTMKTPTNTTSSYSDSCSIATGLKYVLANNKAYLSWSGGFATGYTIKVAVDNGTGSYSYSTYTSSTPCKSVAVVPGKKYRWYVVTDCAIMADKQSEFSEIVVPK
jgi:hypothetical protein